MTVSGSTFSGNSATYYDAGIDNNGGALTLPNSIVAGNLGLHGTPSDIGGSVIAGSNDLIGTGGSGGLANGGNGNLVGVANPGLGVLGNYGGSTQTIPLLPGSPAIDAGANPTSPPATDQHGATRIVNGVIDIGAFESQGSPSPPSAARPRSRPPSTRPSPTRSPWSSPARMATPSSAAWSASPSPPPTTAPARAFPPPP